MADWTAPDFLDSLEDAVKARITAAALPKPNIEVFTFYPSIDIALTDAIILGYHVNDTNTPAAVGNNRYEETVNLQNEIRVARPGAGKDPTREARRRAKTLLGIVDAELRRSPPQVGDQTIQGSIIAREMGQFATHADSSPVRVCLIEFTIQYKARTPKENPTP